MLPSDRSLRERVRIRPFRPGDEVEIADVFDTSVRVAALADYSEAQVAAWAGAAPTAARFAEQATDGRLFLVAVIDATDTTGSAPEGSGGPERIVGYGDLERDGHIDHLYCAPDAVGHGIGALLYDALEGHALEQGYPRLYVEASEAARRLFERQGFAVLHRNDLERDGVDLHNYSMAKPFDIGLGVSQDGVAAATRIVAAIPIRAGRALVGHRHPDRENDPNCWDVVGGHVEAGEEAAEALVRELAEELGIEVAVPDLGSPFRSVWPSSSLRLDIWTLTRWHGEVVNAAPAEHDRLGWFSIDELDDLQWADPRIGETVRAALSSLLEAGPP